MFCNKCGKSLADNLRFCDGCGVDVNENAEPKLQCKCGFANAPDAKYCGACRSALGDEGAATMANVAVPAAASRPIAGRGVRVAVIFVAAAATGYWWLHRAPKSEETERPRPSILNVVKNPVERTKAQIVGTWDDPEASGSGFTFFGDGTGITFLDGGQAENKWTVESKHDRPFLEITSFPSGRKLGFFIEVDGDTMTLWISETNFSATPPNGKSGILKKRPTSK